MEKSSFIFIFCAKIRNISMKMKKKTRQKKDRYARWLKFAGMCSCVLSRMDSMIDSQTIRWLGIITLADS